MVGIPHINMSHLSGGAHPATIQCPEHFRPIAVIPLVELLFAQIDVRKAEAASRPRPKPLRRGVRRIARVVVLVFEIAPALPAIPS